jgi:hypothetical protein
MALLAMPVSVHAVPWGWLVQKSSGKATYQTAQLPVSPLRKGLLLNKGDTVRTGANGKVLLVRGAESVFVGPYSTATIASRAAPGMRTTVLLQKGRVDLSVQTKARPHFSVETPYLVAVVKGTKFQVTASPWRSEVSVSEGRVHVKVLRTGQSVELRAGQKALVDRSGRLSLSGRGKLASISSGMPQTGSRTPANNFSSSGTVSVGGNVATGGVSASAGAQIGGASVGAGASIGGGGVQASGSLGLGGVSLGGGLRVGGQ